MIPHTPESLQFLITRLGTSLAPELRTAYGAFDLGILSLLLGMIANDIERGPAIRHADIEDMRVIFRSAQEVLDRTDLPQNLSALSTRPVPAALTLSELDAVHAEHTAALIELHAKVETSDDDVGRRLNLQIWDYLARHTERHRYDIQGV